ncbi:MAG: DNA polymerase/3'-5' exonuclease PolX [Planctomycetales bacterium]|nr:DNA polymerase/3'-5' exonuclease PolX [Planctomycetales bacterium]
MQNAQIAAIFDRVADLLEFQGANPFRLRAYRNAARTIGDLSEPVAAILADESRSLTDVAGIGDDLASKISTLIETGTLPLLDDLLAKIPASVLGMLRVPGLGPKKAAALYKQLQIESLDQLREACEAGRVRELKGFGKKTEETILEGIDLAAHAEERIYWAEADELVQSLLAHFAKLDCIRQIEPAGSYRRGRETVGDLDFLVDSDAPGRVMDCLAEYSETDRILARGETKMSIRLVGGLQVDLRVVPADLFGAALQYFTGSKDHNVVLRGMAKQKGLKINEWGVFRTAEGDDSYVAGAKEADVYAALELPCFPPELREARQEFQWAHEGNLPQLVEIADIRGDLHMHTTATDGKATLEEMVEAAIARRLQYIAITDHSKRVTMANGLDARRLRAQWKEIDALRDQYGGFTILKGIECDILESGGMDLPDDVLAEADWVVASVHYGQNQSESQITDRILGALENPSVSAIAHPTGRLINRRKPYAVDLEQVLAAAARFGKLMELNANPARLDLDDVACAAAKRHRVPIVISTDAHSTRGLDVMRYGILQARRAGLTKADVANTRDWQELRGLIGKRPAYPTQELAGPTM